MATAWRTGVLTGSLASGLGAAAYPLRRNLPVGVA